MLWPVRRYVSAVLTVSVCFCHKPVLCRSVRTEWAGIWSLPSVYPKKSQLSAKIRRILSFNFVPNSGIWKISRRHVSRNVVLCCDWPAVSGLRLTGTSLHDVIGRVATQCAADDTDCYLVDDGAIIVYTDSLDDSADAKVRSGRRLRRCKKRFFTFFSYFGHVFMFLTFFYFPKVFFKKTLAKFRVASRLTRSTFKITATK